MDLSQFFATFWAAIAMYWPEELDPNLRPIGTNKADLMNEFDFIIVGTGTEGSVVANRLTENPDWTVLVIEAGENEDAVSDTPLLHDFLPNTRFDWNYTTVEQKKACGSTNGICSYPRGRVMGGSSTMFAMLYVRGNQEDYNDWEKAGNPGWGYRDVLPYFVKSENMTIDSLARSGYHGTDGPLKIAYPVYKPDIRDTSIEAGKELGWEHGDVNGEFQNRIDYGQFTLDGPTRDSNSKAFLNPIRKRPNLFFIMNTTVTKVLFEGKTATGVQYYRNGAYYSVSAKKEVILSAGSINTPKVLMLSGIGPKHELRKHNIKILADLPVGQGLRDHPHVQILFHLDHVLTETQYFFTNQSIIDYAEYNRGPLTSPGIDITAFFNTIDNSLPPNFEIISFHFRLANGIVPPENVVNFMGSLVGAKSEGSVKLKSNKWTDDPLIDPNYFSDPTDKEVLKDGLKTIFKFMNTSTMAQLSPQLYTGIYNNCRQTDLDEYLNCMISEYSMTTYNPACTARMGPADDIKTVVTPDLCVKNIKNLRVVDASIMPSLPRVACVLAPSTMIAEKASDIIKAHYYPWYTIYINAFKDLFYVKFFEKNFTN